MGLKGLWKYLGFDANRVSKDNIVCIDIIGKSIGVELSGLIFPMLQKLCKEHRHAESLARHTTDGEKLTDPQLVYHVARDSVQVIG